MVTGGSPFMIGEPIDAAIFRINWRVFIGCNFICGSPSTNDKASCINMSKETLVRALSLAGVFNRYYL